MKIHIYGDKHYLVDKISVLPMGVEPDEIIDLEKASDEDKYKIRLNPKDTQILNKYRNRGNDSNPVEGRPAVLNSEEFKKDLTNKDKSK